MGSRPLGFCCRALLVLHRDVKCKHFAFAGEEADSQANTAQENSEPNAPQRATTPIHDHKSSGYATDVEDEVAGGPKGDLQDHISRNILTPAPEGTGGTVEAQAVSSYEQFPPPQGPVQKAHQKEEAAGEHQLAGQPGKQQMQTSTKVTAAPAQQIAQPSPPPKGPMQKAEQKDGAGKRQMAGQLQAQQVQTSPKIIVRPAQQTAQPINSRHVAVQEQAGAQAAGSADAQALATPPQPAPRRQQVQAPDVDFPETVLLGGPQTMPVRSAARSIPVGGPVPPETRPEPRSAPLMASLPGQWGDTTEWGFGVRGDTPSVGQTGATMDSTAWGAPEPLWQTSSPTQASRSQAGSSQFS